METPKTFVLGICGGSGSGKTTIVKELKQKFNPDQISVINHDAYYQHRPKLSINERRRINFDHPDSLETQLMVAHIQQLMLGKSVQIPVYDFVKHLRSSNTTEVNPCPILILDGILVLNDTKLREMMNLIVYIDVPSDLRFIRRLKRDIFERGRTIESVSRQYLSYVRPMHEKFVEPTKKHANIIIPEGGHNQNAVELLIALIQNILDK